ncbi:MAG: alpha/beta hydrolase [Actinobacteria bacterium]|nr:alpha/beta hydrolase [Actinomycetota bacterium]
MTMSKVPDTSLDGDDRLYVAPLAGELVSVGATELFVRTAGDPAEIAEQTPTIFLHGLGGSSTNWTELMYLLSGQTYGIAPDLPGFGQSPPPHGDDYKLASHAAIVAELIQDLFGTRRVHVFGNSMGGATAVQLAGRYPDLIKSLTLISPALPDLVPRGSSIHLPITAIPGVGERLLRRLARRDPEWRVNASMEICYSDMTRIDPRRMVDQVAEAKERDKLEHTSDAMLLSLRGIMESYFDRSHERPWKLAKSIKAPTLLIYGRDDKLVNPKMALRASKRFPNARVMVVPDSGHVTQMEHPRLVARAWSELIADRT